MASFHCLVATAFFLLLGYLGCGVPRVAATIFHAYPEESCQISNLTDQPAEALCETGGKSFVACVASLKEPGDECRLHAGRYPFRGEPLSIRGLHGTAEKPIVIAAAAGEEADVLIDGTVPVTSNIDDWNLYTFHSLIWVAKAQVDFWQMFVDGVMQTPARWPNALWSDKSVFNATYWAHSANSSNSTTGMMVDDRNAGRSGGWDPFPMYSDLVGAVVVLNTGSWDSYPALVLSHETGYAWFTYNATGQYHDKPSANRYYLEGKLDFLDYGGEWLYNKTEGIAYIIPEDGRTAWEHQITGKVSTYALNITDSSFLTLANLTFFATTIWAASIDEHPVPTFIDHLTISSVDFTYPSCSRRMLQDVSPPLWTLVSSRFYRPGTTDLMVRLADPHHHEDMPAQKWYDLSGNDSDHGFHKIINSSWMYTDSPALNVQGKSCQIVNNYFAYNDWSGADEVVAVGAQATINNQNGFGDYFAHNTLYMNGASTGYRPPPASTIEYNRVTGQCWGDIQHDGAGIQVMAPSQDGTVVSHNWVHDSVKYGIRFDGQPPRTGHNATLKHNVAWHSGGLLVKGDYHLVLSNLAFDLHKESASQVEGQNCSICVYGYVRTNPVTINKNTVTTLNAADFINGGTGNGGHSKTKKVEALPGHASDNVETNIRNEVVDAGNLDFRPRRNSTLLKFGGVGPYESVDNHSSTYWIPGRRVSKASTPVPPNGSVTVQADRNCVMWALGLGARASRVTFLASCPGDGQSVGQRRGNDIAIGHEPGAKGEVLWSSGTIPAPQNVYYLPSNLRAKTRYCWSVDTLNENSLLVQGDVWNFTTL